MKKLFLLTKTLLVAICLLVGATNAWATTTWKTYKTWDFITDFAASDVSSLLPEGSWTTSGSGSAMIATVSTTIASATAVTTSTSNRYYGIKLHANADKMQLASDGICLLGAASYVTIPNLKTGQRVTVIIDNANGVEVYSGSVATLTGVATTSSDSYYKTVGIVGTGGDLTIKRYGGTTFRIRSILVETPIEYVTPALYSQDFESYTVGEDTPGSAGWIQKGGVWSIETSSDASINKYAKFTPGSSDGGNRGAYYNFANAIITGADDYWKIEFDAAFKPGPDRTATSVAITSAKSGYVDSYEAPTGSLYFMCKQKENNKSDYNVYIGSSEDAAVATYSLTEGSFYHFIITYNGTMVTAKIGTNAIVSKSVSSSTIGALKGLKAMASRRSGSTYPYTYIDNITLHNFLPPSFTMSEESKEINAGNNTTVDVTSVVGDINVSSSDESKVTASYADGTLTINGISKGTATVTVSCYKNDVTVSKSIDVTVRGYDELYAEEKAPYDSKVENLDAAGQAYWTANVTSAASVTDEASYNTAVAALPTTYVAAVKAQTTAGSNMTDALKTAVEAASWTGATGTYSGVAAERYAGNNSHFSTGNILHQTVSGLRAGYYKLKFYGVANVARNLTEEYYGSGIAQMYANSETQDVDVIYQDACSPISNTYLREFEVYLAEDNSSIDFGIKNIKEGGQWYVAQALSLYYLGAEKKSYTINAVADETIIKELATGSVWPSETYGVYVPKAILYNSKYYVLDDPNMSNYYASYTMGATNETKEINYTLDESIVAYAEAGSNITQSTSNNASYSSGNYGHVDGKKSISLGTLGAGTYEFAAYYVSNSNRGLYLRNGNIADISTNTIVSPTLSSAGMVYADFQLTSSTPILFTGYTNEHSQYNQSAEFDFIYIRKTGEVATIGSTGWATFSSKNPVNVDVTGLEAYIATGEDGNYVTMQKVTGDVAANTGLVLKGAANTYALPFAASSGTTYNQSSNPKNYLFALDGTFNNVGIAGEGTNYVLSVQSGNVVWAPVTGNLAPAPAGHAALWLPASGGSSARAMRFSGDITAVEAVEAAAEAKSKEGKFIENGKLVIVKNGVKYNAAGQLIK